ncbi:unnamed protein product, partial [Mesorhabditis belari]|uniref:Uncharacterized protein n=1 Tax=Mesorhabditis belari TaxID=2138241 RepID=A0AAF3FLQ6_9BILA
MIRQLGIFLVISDQASFTFICATFYNPFSGASSQMIACPTTPCDGSTCCNNETLVINVSTNQTQCGQQLPPDPVYALPACPTVSCQQCGSLPAFFKPNPLAPYPVGQMTYTYSINVTNCCMVADWDCSRNAGDNMGFQVNDGSGAVAQAQQCPNVDSTKKPEMFPFLCGNDKVWRFHGHTFTNFACYVLGTGAC